MVFNRHDLLALICALILSVGIGACKPVPRKTNVLNAKIGGARIEPTDRLEKLALRLQQHPVENASEAHESTQEGPPRDTCPTGAKLFGAPPPKGSSVYCAKSSLLGNVKMGPYTKWDDKGVKRYEAYFVDDALEGGATNYYPNGEKADYIEYQKGVPNGLWEKWNRKGIKVIEGHFHNGKKDGYFRYWSQEGIPTSEGVLQDGIRSGQWSLFDRSGALKTKLHFVAGDKDGKADTFYQNGTLASSGSYTKNKPDGLWIYYSKEGRVEKRGHYSLGKKVGEWQEFNTKGNVVSTKQLKGPEDPKAMKNKPVINTQNGFVQM